MTTTTTTFDYDTLDRLAGAHYQSPVSNVAYQYDGAGNRTTQTIDGTPTPYTYDAADELATIGGVATAGSGRRAEERDCCSFCDNPLVEEDGVRSLAAARRAVRHGVYSGGF